MNPNHKCFCTCSNARLGQSFSPQDIKSITLRSLHDVLNLHFHKYTIIAFIYNNKIEKLMSYNDAIRILKIASL